MPFPPPTDGFVESPIGDNIVDYLAPKKSSTFMYPLSEPYPPLHLEAGDVLVVEQGRNPHQNCHAVIEQDGEVMVCQLVWNNGHWYAIAGERKGKVTENMVLLGVARHSIKSQI